ncbi:predicted protein [Naegleria gruberi]|uniref:Predicted protein n=1 Tax=Naegleria gruberi TaxID=5762 RepID=D2VXE4_NAEGR|nr:uncharacterized protein NAEGRDRAFT_59499 [Naegleria gruberi]EFC38494.1 predicted protein [Naegleria gruberi]|eukprot:XP_002671238.1 predicted protein [Naegleria gruberi strain NEG-M]
MSDDSLNTFSSTNTSSESDGVQNDTTAHTDTMTESDVVTVVPSVPTNSNKKAFHPDNYEIIYEEAIKNPEFRSLFRKVQSGECSEEPFEFLKMTDEYVASYQSMHSRKEFQAVFSSGNSTSTSSTNPSTATTTTTSSNSSTSNNNNIQNNNSSTPTNQQQPSSLSSSVNTTSSQIGIIIANDNNTMTLPQMVLTSDTTQHPAEMVTSPASPSSKPNIQNTTPNNIANSNTSTTTRRDQTGCLAPLIRSTLGTLGGVVCVASTTIPTTSSNSHSNLSRVISDLTKLKHSAGAIYDHFLKPNSSYQLNLGWNKAKILANWESIHKQFENLIGKSEEVEDLQALSDLITRLHPVNLFRDVIEKVHLDLKMDQFPRFVRSNACKTFFKRKGEQFMRQMAFDISKGYKVDLRFKPQDLRKDVVTDSDIYFGFTLAEDTPDWELFFDENNTQCYLSKETYSFDPQKMKGMKLAKTVMLLPYALEDCWAMFWHGDFHKIYDPLSFSENTFVHYTPPSPQVQEDGSNYFGKTYGRTVIDLSMPLLKKRVYDYIYCTVWDDGLDAFINVGKSVDPSITSKYLSEEENKKTENYVEAPGLFYHIFTRTHEGKTRYCQMTYFDLGLPLNSDFIFKMIWRKRTKIYRDGFIQVLNHLTDKGKKKADHSKLVDSLYFKRPVDDLKKIRSYRSWHDEWQKILGKISPDVVTKPDPLLLVQTEPADPKSSTSTEPESVRIVLKQEEEATQQELQISQENNSQRIILSNEEEIVIIEEDEDTLQTRDNTKARDEPEDPKP